MGTTSQKLTYLNDTKGLLKQKINNLGGDITDETTFRQYADKLQNVYDILPKTDYEEGSNITLSNTLKGKLDFENDIVGYGDTKQEGTPTPDSPQEIEVVRGTQTVYIKDENNNVITTTEIDLGEYEFAKIGNYVDTIEYDVENDKVYKNKAIGKVVFNGSETGWERNTTTLGYRYRINQLDIKPNVDNSTIASMYCNYLRATSPDRLYNNDNYSISCFSGTSHVIIIACIDTDTDTLEKWKTWLSTHNLEVYYVLAEALKEEITGTLKDQIKALYNSQSFTGTTIITSNGELPLVLKVRALKG